jgi:hypothetical protein
MSTSLPTPVAVEADEDAVPPTWWSGCCCCLLLLVSATFTIAVLAAVVKAILGK